MSLKQKTVSGLLWSFIDNFAKLGLTFFIGIILARLLTPREFGLIGMITIFIALSQSLVDSGFTQALIRKKDCTQADFSTVFYFNLFVGIVLYAVLFFSAGAISRFFDEPQLRLIVQVVGLSIIVNAFTIVQRARLTKEINFKLQTKISIIASICSGVFGIVMAYTGYGVWSLVYKTLLGFAITSLFLWLWNKWKPTLVFSRNSFKEMFSFGYKLMISGLIDTAYRNIYLLIIGKYFSATELGFYTRADQFKNLPSQNITGVIQRVSYPVLAEMQGDIPRLKTAYQKIIKSTMLITFVSMMIMVAIAKPLVLVLIGEKWLPSVVYLQLLSFVGMLYPLHAINLNMLNVQGRSDLFLRLEIIKKILAIPVIVIGVLLGIEMMIVGMILISVISYFLNSYYSGQHIGYSSMQQLKDILPSFVLALFIGALVYLIGMFLDLPNYLILIIQLIAGGGIFFVLAELFKMKDYIFVKEIFLEKLMKRKND
ncbi:MAG: lipopolysaccharide biosynthesis protein [Bacteroidales bacterium]|jgi:O-antigen/teichoic acid export membrane protein|nr:lipopolysaccharide biosynthesis protein [Bacteroidales bacterium]